MARHKRTAADGFSIDGGKAGKALHGSIPIAYDTTSAPRSQGAIARLLLHGAENGVGLRDLAAQIGTDTRTVRKAIQSERLHGAPILSDNTHGYFMPSSDAELKRCVRSLRGRAAEIERTADALERAMDGNETRKARRDDLL